MRQRLALAALVLVAACTRDPSGSDSADSADTADTAPALDPTFTLVAIPDIQYLSNADSPMLPDMMEEILATADDLDTAFVLQEGDLTHTDDAAAWAAADAAFDLLDGHVPYTVCVGNHDETDGDTTGFNSVFGLDRWQATDTFLATASPDEADNHAHAFTAGGLDWLVVSLTYGPPDDALAWAAELVASHPDHSVVVLTHAYLTPSATTGTPGRGVQEQVVDPHANVKLVLNGHYITGTNAMRRRARDDGSEVVEVFANYQDLVLAGLGRMRQMRIDTEAGTLDVTSCNAFGVCSDDEGDTFVLEGLDWRP